MKPDWYKNVNPNLDRLAQLLGMASGPKPSHGYTIAEKAPEVVTAPGVYFPAEKGEVIPLESRQGGGAVSSSYTGSELMYPWSPFLMSRREAKNIKDITRPVQYESAVKFPEVEKPELGTPGFLPISEQLQKMLSPSSAMKQNRRPEFERFESLISRQKGGIVTPSSSKDDKGRGLDILESIIQKVNPSGMEAKAMMGLTFPPESMKTELEKFKILSKAMDILKPPKPLGQGGGGGGTSQAKTSSPKSTPSNTGVNLPAPPTLPTVPTSMEGIPTPQSIQPEIRTDSPEINPMSESLVNLRPNEKDTWSAPMFSRQGGGEVVPSYGFRPDGTPKGKGFMGELSGREPGMVSTELSIGVNLDGKETQIPTLIPGLKSEEIDYLLGGGKPTPAIIDKAVEHARQRMFQGLSPFAQEGEQKPMTFESRQVGGNVTPTFEEFKKKYPADWSEEKLKSLAMAAGIPTRSDFRKSYVASEVPEVSETIRETTLPPLPIIKRGEEIPAPPTPAPASRGEYPREGEAPGYYPQLSESQRQQLPGLTTEVIRGTPYSPKFTKEGKMVPGGTHSVIDWGKGEGEKLHPSFMETYGLAGETTKPGSPEGKLAMDLYGKPLSQLTPEELKDVREKNITPYQQESLELRKESSEANRELRRESLEQSKRFHDENLALRKDLGNIALNLRKRVPANLVKGVKEKTTNLDQYASLIDEFKPNYGGKIALGPTFTGIHEKLGTDKERVLWWKKFKQLDVLLRHEMFGSMLSVHEQKSWDAVTVSENSSPDIIKPAIQNRLKIAKNALDREIEGYEEAGYELGEKGNKPKGTTSEKTIIKKFISPSTGKTKYIYSDGTEEIK